MASSINALTSSGGGVVTTADSSGVLNLQSNSTTIAAVSSTGLSVTGSITATGQINGTLGVGQTWQDLTASRSTSTVNAGSFVIGNSYTIVTVGTTIFTSIGASANTVGVSFTATGVGSGTGTARNTYRNTTGNPIQVNTTIVVSASGNALLQVDGVTVGSMSNQFGDRTLTATLNGVVPNQSYYQVTSGTISVWAELR